MPPRLKKKKYPFRDARQTEWGLKNYLNKHNIYKDNWDFQTIIINSFYNQRGLSNDAPWKEKVLYTQEHFGLFAQYAQNNWNHETNTPTTTL